MLLCLETSTKVCSVALGKNGKLLSLKESAEENYSHSENLTVYVEEVCRLASASPSFGGQAKISLSDIDAVAVSKGPGSFTGLRIGVSTAKGICYALDKPLIAVNTLQAMAWGARRKVKKLESERVRRGESEKVRRSLSLSHFTTFSFSHFPTSFFCPMIDAKRMEVYCAVYDEQLNEIKKTLAAIIDENSFSDLLKENKIIFFGDGAEKCRTKIKHPNAVFMEGIVPSAQFMIPLAEKHFKERKFEDLAYFEPFYLKDFVAKRN